MSSLGFENLELLFSNLRDSSYFAVRNHQSLNPFFAKHIAPERLIILPRSVNDDELLIAQDGITQIAQKAGSFWLTKNSSIALEKWSKANAVPLISPTFGFQEKLENKIFFEKFAQANDLPTPESLALESAEDLKQWKTFPAVLQIPTSQGGQGTFYIESREELKKIIATEAKRFPLLIRRYVEGQALGVTLLITTNEIIISALREQMIFMKESSFNKYLGIQWLPTNSLTKKALSKIEAVLKNLGKALQRLKFRGQAGIDLIWDGENVYLLECNPRSTLSSIQISQNSQLFHGLNFCEKVFNTYTKDRLTKNLTNIPDSNFEGTTLDLDYFGTPFYGHKLKKALQIGIYTIEKDNLQFRDNDITNFNGLNEIFLYSECTENEPLQKSSDMGLAMTNHSISENASTVKALNDFFRKALN